MFMERQSQQGRDAFNLVCLCDKIFFLLLLVVFCFLSSILEYQSSTVFNAAEMLIIGLNKGYQKGTK